MKQNLYPKDQDLVAVALNGVVAANPQLAHLKHNVLVYRPSYRSGIDKVTLVSGGGSGHEPTHTGFVGEGLLDAVAVGQIFASPTAMQIDYALDSVETPKGSLIIVKNYTGDVFHFGAASEKAKVAGKKTRVVIVGDDVAVGRKQGKLVGRRGLAGIVLVHKVAGASAAAGNDLDTVAEHAEAVANNLVTIGSSLDHCTVPGRSFHSDIKDDEVEIGLGIHNEAGVFRDSPIPPIGELVDKMLGMMLDQKDEDRAFVPFKNGDEVLLLVNNLGGLSPFEISYITSIALKNVAAKKLSVIRVLSGTFTTAFNGPGFSLTLLNLSRAGSEILKLIDAKARAPGWVSAVAPQEWNPKQLEEKEEVQQELPPSGVTLPKSFAAPLHKGLDALIAAEPKITEYDLIAGDGDCGETLKAGAEALLKVLDELPSDAVHAVMAIAEVVSEAMGGTSGGIYYIFITAFAQSVKEQKPETLDMKAAAAAAKAALESLFKYSKARVGDRTLVDALQPFVDTLYETGNVSKAVEAADTGMKKTAELQAKAGRAAYVQQDSLVDQNIPDPGAYGLVELLKGWSGSS